MKVLFVQIFTAGYLTGLIWIIQVVHYPLMARVPLHAFVGYEGAHQRLITPLVLLPMLADLVTAGMLPFTSLGQRYPFISYAIAVLAGVTWASTAFLQVPLHGQLSAATDSQALQTAVSRLVATNWVRTFAWSAKFLLVLSLLWMLVKSLPRM
jgi:hypothetical protein